MSVAGRGPPVGLTGRRLSRTEKHKPTQCVGELMLALFARGPRGRGLRRMTYNRSQCTCNVLGDVVAVATSGSDSDSHRTAGRGRGGSYDSCASKHPAIVSEAPRSSASSGRWAGPLAPGGVAHSQHMRERGARCAWW